jgi:two-component system phosphate regulon sensor histidine kinase PhoR
LSALAWLFLALVAAAVLAAAYACILPLLRIRRALRELSAGDWQAPFRLHPHGTAPGMAADLIALGDRLGKMHRHLADETFSLRALLSSLGEGVLIVDSAHRIQLANDSLHRMFDLPAPLAERTLMEVFRDHTLQASVDAALKTNAHPQSLEIALDTRQGSQYVRKHFTVTAAGLLPPGTERAQSAIVIFHDISELKALESVRRDFVANVSHELRTPVSIINGYLETLLDGALADPRVAEKFLRTVWKHNQRLTLLIEDLLSVSALETRQASGLTFEPVQLRACLERVIDRLEPRIAEKHAVLEVDVPEGVPPMQADAHRLDQVFFNLIENALKYGEAERPVIRIKACFAGEEVRITVSDNGPGIPLSDQPHVFERFYRVRKDRSRAEGGTGLGLSIVKHVVQAHGGDVLVQSKPGQGAAFSLRLPILQKP